MMGLSLSLIELRQVDVAEFNITHNLTSMAKASGLYDCIWQPNEIGCIKANQLIPHLRLGLEFLECNPETMKKHNPKNGWGNYDSFISFVKRYLASCEKYPDAIIWSWG